MHIYTHTHIFYLYIFQSVLVQITAPPRRFGEQHLTCMFHYRCYSYVLNLNDFPTTNQFSKYIRRLLRHRQKEDYLVASMPESSQLLKNFLLKAKCKNLHLLCFPRSSITFQLFRMFPGQCSPPYLNVFVTTANKPLHFDIPGNPQIGAEAAIDL